MRSASCLPIAACLAPAALTAAIIDRIAVAVGNQAITSGEITHEIRLAALLNGEVPDESVDSRRKAADRLIEQTLVRREMAFSSYPPIPGAQVEQALGALETTRGGADALDRLLERYKLTRRDLRAYLTWQAELLKFIDLRFRPAVQVTNTDIEKYYHDSIAAANPSGKAPALNDVRDQIEKTLVAERVDRQLDDWLKRSRARSVIRYIDPSLTSAPAAEK
jgi:hypothetical protein